MDALRAHSKLSDIAVYSVGRADGFDFSMDLRDPAAWVRVLKDVSPTAIIHLAAIAAPGDAKANPGAAWETNFKATVDLASSIMRYAPDCRLVYAGSSEVYGATFNESKSVKESASLRPTSLYGATKAAADVALGQMHYDGLRSVRFRPFNHSGPRQSPNFVLPAFASQIAKIKVSGQFPEVQVGALEVVRDFLHVRDVASAYVNAALDEERNLDGRVFNLSSGSPVPVQYILDKLISLSGLEIAVSQDTARIRQSEIPYAAADSSAARSLLRWEPKYTLDDLIEDVFNYWVSLEQKLVTGRNHQ